MRGKCDNEEEDLNWAHMFSGVSRYKRGSDITKGGIMNVRVYLWMFRFNDHVEWRVLCIHDDGVTYYYSIVCLCSILCLAFEMGLHCHSIIQ